MTHTIIPTGDRLRWLEVEEIDGDINEIKITLNEIYAVPSHWHIKKRAKAAAT